MDVDWDDPRMVGLHERLAVAIQTEYEHSVGADALTSWRSSRAATTILGSATGAQVGPDGAVTLTFAGETFPHRPDDRHLCRTCSVNEGQLHHDHCRRAGTVMRAPDAPVTL